MEKWKKRSLELVLGLALTNKKNPAVVPFVPQKTLVSQPERPYFKRRSPEAHGIPTSHIVEMLHALENDTRVHLHSLMVIKGGEVIAECSAPGYDTHIAHLSHSMSKTVTGIAVGMLIDDGKLSVDDKVISFFPEISAPSKKLEALTVKHLLTMQSGVPFSEAGSVTEVDWTEAFLTATPDFDVGSKFAYNSMNSYMLARIVSRVTGTTLCSFLEERLFSPLGITNYFWEMGPEGVEKGGWGLFLSVESWAKLGMLVHSGGVFEGRRIVSSEFIREATTAHSISPQSSGDFNYGYQIWVSRTGYEVLFNGMLGQNVWIYPDGDLVVALNAGNNELFQQSPALDIIRKYLKERPALPLVESAQNARMLALAKRDFFEARHWIRPKKKKSGLGVLLHLRAQDPYIPAWDALLGTYMFRDNNYGILPVFIRAMQNNYSGGIESFRFHKEGKHLYFTSREGGVDYTLELGLYEYKQTVLTFNGEPYIVRALAVAIRDEDYRPVFKIELVLPEMPNRRALKLSFLREGELLVRMDEMPNQRIATAFIDSMPVTNPRMEFLTKLMGRKLGENFLEEKITELFAPILVGARYGSSDYSDILHQQEQRLQEELSRTAFLTQTLEKYASDDKGKKKADTERSGFFRNLFEKLKGHVMDTLSPTRDGISSQGRLPERIDPSDAFIILDEDHPVYSLPEHLRPKLDAQDDEQDNAEDDELSDQILEMVDTGEVTVEEILDELEK